MVQRNKNGRGGPGRSWDSWRTWVLRGLITSLLGLVAKPIHGWLEAHSHIFAVDWVLTPVSATIALLALDTLCALAGVIAVRVWSANSPCTPALSVWLWCRAGLSTFQMLVYARVIPIGHEQHCAAVYGLCGLVQAAALVDVNLGSARNKWVELGARAVALTLIVALLTTSASDEQAFQLLAFLAVGVKIASEVLIGMRRGVELSGLAQACWTVFVAAAALQAFVFGTEPTLGAAVSTSLTLFGWHPVLALATRCAGHARRAEV